MELGEPFDPDAFAEALTIWTAPGVVADDSRPDRHRCPGAAHAAAALGSAADSLLRRRSNADTLLRAIAISRIAP
jgi:hypothetical protein